MSKNKKQQAYKYRLYPTDEQIPVLYQCFAYRRRAWNHIHAAVMDYKVPEGEKLKTNKVASEAMKVFRTFKHEEENAWMKSLDYDIPEYAQLRYGSAWSAFYRQAKNGTLQQKRNRYIAKRKSAGMPINPKHLDNICKPKFASAKDPEQSFQVKAKRDGEYKINLQIDSCDKWGFFEIKGIPGFLKFRKHRGMFFDDISTVTVSVDTIGQFYVSFGTSQDIELPKIPPKPKKGEEKRVLGIDSNVKGFYCSDNKEFEHPHPAIKFEKRKAFLQKRLKKKEKGSKRYEKWRKRLAKLEKRIARIREDHLHRLSLFLATRKDVDVILVEKLHLEKMAAKPFPVMREDGHFLPNGAKDKSRLNKLMRDAAHAKFVEMLDYKCEWYGKRLKVVDSLEKTNRTCAECGHDNEHVHFRMKTWTCAECGTTHGKYENGSKLLRNKFLGLD